MTKQISYIMLGSGILIAAFAYMFYDTAPEGTHNFGLLQKQLMLFHFGLALSLSGVIFSKSHDGND
jgi:hypothetical protein